MEATAKRRNVGTDLTEGSILKALLVFAVPIILANLIQQLYSLVDLIVIGQYMGNTGTVGVSTGGEISDMLTPIATSFSAACQIYVAQLIGAQEKKRVQTAIGTSISVMMLMSLIFLVGTVAFYRQILTLLNCPQEAFGQAASYMVITCIGMPFIFGYNAVCGVLRGLGESKAPMRFICIAAAVNIVLDVILVVAFRMEAAGTAIATVVSQFASFAASALYMYRHRKNFGFELKLEHFKINMQDCKVIMGLGIPQALRSTLVRFSMLWVNANVNSYGIVASATNSVGNKLQKFLEVGTTGLSQAAAAMVGQNLGARKIDRCKKIVLYSFYSGLVIAACISALCFFFPKAVFGVFTQDAAVLEMGVIYLRIMVFHFFLSALTSAFQSMVIGSGHASLNFVIGIMDGIVCKIGFSILFAWGLGMGAIGFFWGTALSRAIPGVICVAYFLSGRWENRKLLGKK
jgi:putative MATE family efflux protein